MTTAAMYDSDGKITTLRTGDERSVRIDAEASGMLYVITSNEVDLDRNYINPDTKEICEYPEQPSESHTFNYESGAWQFSLSIGKSQLWRGIKISRDQSEFGGFVFDGATYDSDTTAQQRIQGAMLLASQDSSASMTWTLANNNTVELNAEKIINLGKALAEHVNSVHDKARDLRVKIEAATSTSELDEIAW